MLSISNWTLGSEESWISVLILISSLKHLKAQISLESVHLRRILYHSSSTKPRRLGLDTNQTVNVNNLTTKSGDLEIIVRAVRGCKVQSATDMMPPNDLLVCQMMTDGFPSDVRSVGERRRGADTPFKWSGTKWNDLKVGNLAIRFEKWLWHSNLIRTSTFLIITAEWRKLLCLLISVGPL